MSAATKAPVTAIALELIHESPDNPRKFFDAAFVDRMARSLAELGQLTRATVRPHPTKPGHYELAAGATRRRAADAKEVAARKAKAEVIEKALPTRREAAMTPAAVAWAARWPVATVRARLRQLATHPLSPVERVRVVGAHGTRPMWLYYRAGVGS